LLEAVTDPFEPIMPGNLKAEQAEKYAEALKRGQPNANRIALTLYRDAVDDFDDNAKAITDALEKAGVKTPASSPADGEPQRALDAQRDGAPERNA
jgi:hypothetical protein